MPSMFGFLCGCDNGSDKITSKSFGRVVYPDTVPNTQSRTAPPTTQQSRTFNALATRNTVLVNSTGTFIKDSLSSIIITLKQKTAETAVFIFLRRGGEYLLHVIVVFQRFD